MPLQACAASRSACRPEISRTVGIILVAQLPALLLRRRCAIVCLRGAGLFALNTRVLCVQARAFIKTVLVGQQAWHTSFLQINSLLARQTEAHTAIILQVPNSVNCDTCPARAHISEQSIVGAYPAVNAALLPSTCNRIHCHRQWQNLWYDATQMHREPSEIAAVQVVTIVFNRFSRND